MSFDAASWIMNPFILLFLTAPDYKRPTADMIDELPDQIDVGEGCRFAPRCMVKKEEYMKESPARVFVAGEHCAACALCENSKA